MVAGPASAGAATRARLVKDIDPGRTSSLPMGMAGLRGKLYFDASKPGQSLPTELWRSDGSAKGTKLVKVFRPGSTGGGSFFTGLTVFDGKLFFTARHSTLGLELWKSDGTAKGTKLVKDIKRGHPGSVPTGLTSVGGTLFFDASDGVHGQELWKSNGSAGGTVMVKDINPGPAASTPGWVNPSFSQITNVTGTAFFVAYDGVHGTELWKSDGTAAGTAMVKDINPLGNSDPRELTNMGGTLFFVATDPVHGRELWKSDGSEGGTTMVKEINPGGALDPLRDNFPINLTPVNGTLFFEAFDLTHGFEPWKSDGSADGTMLIRDIVPGPERSIPLGLYLENPSVANSGGTFFFSATDSHHGAELWKSDGSASGTMLVKDINRGSGNSVPDQLTNVSGALFFSADDGKHGVELWKSKGTASGTKLVTDINRGEHASLPAILTPVGGKLYFSAFDRHHGRELWVTSGH